MLFFAEFHQSTQGMHLKPYDRLPQLGPSGLTLLTWNVLIPNSNDGWWIYKMYEPTGSAGGPAADVHTTWAHRQGLMRDRLLEAAPDIICLQETSHVTDQAFANDWAFLREAGYECAVLSRGRMRPATFWKSSKLRLCCADGSLPSAPSALTGTPEHGGKAEPATSAEPAADKAETAGKVEGKGAAGAAVAEAGEAAEPAEAAGVVLHGDRTLTTMFRLLDAEGQPAIAAPPVFVINCHLAAGEEARRRLRQVHTTLKPDCMLIASPISEEARRWLRQAHTTLSRPLRTSEDL
jgi:hypothetical protein